MQKTFAVNGNKMNGTITMKMVRDNTAVAVYWPAGMDVAPSVITQDMKTKCDAIKKKYNLIEIC